MPINRTTEQIYYNQRILIDNHILTEPRSWKVSKINRVSVNGLITFTCAQDTFDENKDYVEKDSNGEVVALWADYYESNIQPTDGDDQSSTVKSEITYSGRKPELKVGGNYKKFTVTLYDTDGNAIETTSSEYDYKRFVFVIDDVDCVIDMINYDSDKNAIIVYKDNVEIIRVKTFEQSTDLQKNQIKAMFVGAQTYLGKVIKLKYIDTEGVELEVEITSL